MRLAELKRTYDAIYSLGSNCYPTQRLERYGLRPYSGVLDWMYSNSVPGLCALLRNRFDHFMHPANLVVDGTAFNGHNFSVLDCVYGTQSVHDFLCADQEAGIKANYPRFQAKMQRRTARFLDKVDRCQWLFFFRLHAAYEEAVALEAALASIVKHRFTLLIANPSTANNIVEQAWSLAHTCAVDIPTGWDADSDQLWNAVFTGIHYRIESC